MCVLHLIVIDFDPQTFAFDTVYRPELIHCYDKAIAEARTIIEEIEK